MTQGNKVTIMSDTALIPNKFNASALSGLKEQQKSQMKIFQDI